MLRCFIFGLQKQQEQDETDKSQKEQILKLEEEMAEMKSKMQGDHKHFIVHIFSNS